MTKQQGFFTQPLLSVSYRAPATSLTASVSAANPRHSPTPVVDIMGCVYISIYIIYLYSTPLYTHISGWIKETHQPEVGLSSGKVPSVTIGVTSL